MSCRTLGQGTGRLREEPEPESRKPLRSQAGCSPPGALLSALLSGSFWISTSLLSFLAELCPLFLLEQSQIWRPLCPRKKWVGISESQQQDHERVSLIGPVKNQATIGRVLGKHDCPVGGLVVRESSRDWGDLPQEHPPALSREQDTGTLVLVLLPATSSVSGPLPSSGCLSSPSASYGSLCWFLLKFALLCVFSEVSKNTEMWERWHVK